MTNETKKQVKETKKSEIAKVLEEMNLDPKKQKQIMVAVLDKAEDTKEHGAMIAGLISRTGIFQTSDARTKHTVTVGQFSLTSCFASEDGKKTGTFGNREFVNYGAYLSNLRYNPIQAKQYNYDYARISKFENALCNFSEIVNSNIKGSISTLLVVKVYKDNANALNMDDLVEFKQNEMVLAADDVEIDFTKLIETLKGENVELYVANPKFSFKRFPELKTLVEELPHKDLLETSQSMELHDKYAEYFVIYEVVKGNPNGDPNNGNRPRTILNQEGEEFGLISPERQKRWLRDYKEVVDGEFIFASRNRDEAVTPAQRMLDIMKDMNANGELDEFKK